MKNKLLSIFSVLLLSCQHSPAYAQIVDKTLNTTTLNLYADVVEQDSIIFPVSREKQEYIPQNTKFIELLLLVGYYGEY